MCTSLSETLNPRSYRNLKHPKKYWRNTNSVDISPQDFEKIQVPLFHANDVDWLFRRPTIIKTYLDLGLLDSLKELTESVSICKTMRHLIKYFQIETKNSVILAIGDGVKPRTGLLANLLTNFEVHSIDPELRPEQFKVKDFPEQCYLHKCTIEKWIEEQNPNESVQNLIILLPHSHAEIRKNYDAIRALYPCNQLIVTISLDCCIKQKIDCTECKLILKEPSYGIISPKNEIKVWLETKLKHDFATIPRKEDTPKKEKSKNVTDAIIDVTGLFE